jgi:uncharacterized protein (TIGR00255 family)
MLKSMTGFVSSNFKIKDKEFHLEIKTLNTRFLDPKLRLPYEYYSWENPILNIIKKTIQRGRVDVFIGIEANSNLKPQLQYKKINEHVKFLKDVKKKFSLAGDIDLNLLFSFK